MKRGEKRYFNLLYTVTVAQFKLKDQNTFFGFAWSFLNPLLMLSVLFLLFNMRLGKDIDHYAIYLLVGLIHYTHFSNCTSAAMRILSSKLVSSTLFPKEILVIGSVLANSIEFFIAMVVCLIIAALSGVGISWRVFALLGVLGLQVIIVVWISLLLSCIYLFIRDFAHIYEVFLKILLFITPIFYSISFLENSPARYIVQVNPLTHLIELSRTLVLDAQFFSPTFFLLAFLLNVFLLAGSLLVFTKCEPNLAERI